MKAATEAPAGVLGISGAALPLAALDRLLARARDVGVFSGAWISIFDDGAERLLARSGVAFDALPANRSIALAAASLRAPLFVEDLGSAGFAGHWLAGAETAARFIAIVPLVSCQGPVVGTLTVIDRVARRLESRAKRALENLAALAIAHLEARRDGAPAQDAGRREDALHRERQFAEALLESVDGAVALVGDDGGLARWNAALTRAAGRSHAQIGRMSALELFPPAHRESAAAAMREAAVHGRETSVECEIADGAGERRTHLVTIARVRLGAGRSLLLVARDVASQRRAEYLALL